MRKLEWTTIKRCPFDSEGHESPPFRMTVTNQKIECSMVVGFNVITLFITWARFGWSKYEAAASAKAYCQKIADCVAEGKS